MIDDYYRAYFVPTYKERQAEAFDNLRNRVAAYSGDGRESIKYRPVSKEQVFAVKSKSHRAPSCRPFRGDHAGDLRLSD